MLDHNRMSTPPRDRGGQGYHESSTDRRRQGKRINFPKLLANNCYPSQLSTV